MFESDLLDNVSDDDAQISGLHHDGHSAALRSASTEVEKLLDHPLHACGRLGEHQLQPVTYRLRRVRSRQCLATDRENIQRLAQVMRQDCQKALAKTRFLSQRPLR